MKKVLILTLSFFSAITMMAQTTVTADKVVAKQSLYIKDTYIDSVQRDTAFANQVRAIPSSNAVKRFVEGRINAIPVPSSSSLHIVKQLPDWGDGESMQLDYDLADSSNDDFMSTYSHKYFSGGVLDQSFNQTHSAFGINTNLVDETSPANTYYHQHSIQLGQTTETVVRNGYTGNRFITANGAQTSIQRGSTNQWAYQTVDGINNAVGPVNVFYSGSSLDGLGNKITEYPDSTNFSKPVYFTNGALARSSFRVINSGTTDYLNVNATNTTVSNKLILNGGAQVNSLSTGTASFNLSLDASNNVIKTTAPAVVNTTNFSSGFGKRQSYAWSIQEGIETKGFNLTTTGTFYAPLAQASSSDIYMLAHPHTALGFPAGANQSCGWTQTNYGFVPEFGFKTVLRWGLELGDFSSTERGLVCLANSYSAFANANTASTTRLEFVGFGWEPGDTHLSLMYNDASGTATKTDLGASFPVPLEYGDYYEVEWSAPGGVNQINWRIKHLVTGAETSGTLTTNIPFWDRYLAHHGFFQNGAGSSSIKVAFSEIYGEQN